MEHQIFRFAEMILRDRCSTSYDLTSLFSWQAQYFRQVEWKNRKTHWYKAVSSALNFQFLKEVLQNWQNCFVFDVVKFKNFVSFLTLSSPKIEEVSQNCCVFKLAGRQLDG